MQQNRSRKFTQVYANDDDSEENWNREWCILQQSLGSYVVITSTAGSGNNSYGRKGSSASKATYGHPHVTYATDAARTTGATRQGRSVRQVFVDSHIQAAFPKSYLHLIIIIWHLRDTRHWIRSHELMQLERYSFPITPCRRACESSTWHVFFQMGCQHDPTCWWSATLILNLRLWWSIWWHNRGSFSRLNRWCTWHEDTFKDEDFWYQDQTNFL